MANTIYLITAWAIITPILVLSMHLHARYTIRRMRSEYLLRGWSCKRCGVFHGQFRDYANCRSCGIRRGAKA